MAPFGDSSDASAVAACFTFSHAGCCVSVEVSDATVVMAHSHVSGWALSRTRGPGAQLFGLAAVVS